MTIRNAVKALAPYHFTPHPEPIKLDQNESPDDVPELIKVRVMQQLAGVAWNRYPELSPARLEGKLAAKHEWPTAGVVVANGSNTLIQALTIVAGLGRKVITVAPTFAVYAAQARLLEARLIEVPLGADFALPSSALLSAMAGGPGVLFLANPAAPTGNLFSAAQIEELIEAGADQTLVVIDEAYAEFAGADLVKLVARYPNAVILRTFSKAFGLAGARVGYALAHAEVAQEVRKALLPFSVNPWQVAVASVLL
ncbi:MAG TPA: aminotransferase class I/II-fold pyridoxal phosphate-dependent enzyme, partial [Trueperaceae bacterium]|nr:aminotransferase class I/II-fold pyridoxal phosphate-dependent enzyme [Trueperaceae bacterium]